MPKTAGDRVAEPLRLDSPVAAMSGIGPKRAAALAERGIVTASDLIFHLPSRYQDWRERTPPSGLQAGKIVVIEGDLGKINERPMRGARWRRLATGWLNADGRQIRLVWFNLPAYMRGYLPGGERVLVRGRVGVGADDGIEIVQPEVHPLSQGEPKPIKPVYRLPAIVGQRLFASLVGVRSKKPVIQFAAHCPWIFAERSRVFARGWHSSTTRRLTRTSTRLCAANRQVTSRSLPMNCLHSSLRFQSKGPAASVARESLSMARRISVPQW